METTDLLLDAVEDYVSRACTPLAQKILELERRLAEAVARPGEPGPAGERGEPGEPGIAGPRGERGSDGLNGDSVHPDTVRVMLVDVAREEIGKAFALIPRPADGKDADPLHTAELVEAAVARQFELLRPHIKGAPGERGLGIDDSVLEHDEATGVATWVLARDGERRVVGTMAGLPHDGGLYQRGKSYRKGAYVTYGGSMFVARCDTGAEIGGNPPSPDWRMCVQRGRNGS